ncbi:uncharacterized protein LOC111060607 [Nilaparvata lugens]|uniref:uncharacterized protein LOC111060607 n=1 Tax=Nilaparvata lugens TaxID=108931 RepID=UPI00193DD01E|nr:uncharacterized protein LOC111060607 [Nilaparvata lugens]XP_039276644.1 uncharacterized protein LOC111060607 [Nilaparvata lugens]
MHCLAQALKKSQVLSVEFCHSSLNSESMKILATCLEDTKITSINFSGNDLNYDAIACLVAVLPGTEITSIDLSYTTLNSVSLSLLSSCLKDTKITSINLSNNNLDFDAIESLALALPKAHITSLNLSYTSMHCGSLMIIATCLAETQIASLNLSGNLFRFDAINQLAHALPGTEITSINLSRTNLDFECLKAFSSCLKDTKITSLSLRGNAFGNSGVIFLSNALENTSITSIDVGENDLTCTGLKVLASCLIGKEIRSLDLSDNKFGYASIKHLASCLKECEIADLNLSNSSIECNSLKNLVLSLPDTKLRALDLSGNTICCNTFYLAAVLKHTQITKLNLSNNKFGDHSPINFLLRLKTMNHFSLNLSRENNTCSVSFFYLASILKTRDIRFLDLSNTDIDYDELEYLSRGLCGSSVVSLNLSNNKMIHNNAHYLARVLKYTKISSLNLTNTDIARDDFRCLVQGLRGSPVTSLNLSDNQFLDDDCLKYLARNLERTKIIELVLYGMKIDHKTADNILISFVQCETNGCVTIAFDDYVFHRRVNLFRYPGCEIEINQPSLHKGVDNLILLNKGFQKSGITKLIIHDCNQSPEIPHLFGAFDNINIKEIELKMTTLDKYIASMLQKTKIGELKVNSLDLRIAAETKLECISLKFECMTGLNVFDAKAEPERDVSVCHRPVSNNCTVEDQMCLNRRRAESHPNPPLHFENAFFSEIKSFIIASGILYLDIREINMGYEEFKPLPEALKYSKVISLNLSNNKIGPRCIELLAEVLPSTGIVYIDLEGNDIGLTGFESLMGVLRKTNVCWLSLGGNGIERVLPNYIQLSPFIVPRSDNLISFQIRYLFNELVSLNTSNNSFEFTVPKNHSNPPVSSKHYCILIKHLLETPSYNIHIYDMIYMKSKVHNFNVMKIIDSFITDIENRFINFILEHIEHLKQFFGDDSNLEILKTFEYLMLENMVGKLLLHKSLFYVNDEEYILHPFVYKMLHKYGMSLLIEPDKREKIISFFVNNPEIDGAYELVDLLNSDTFVSHGDTSGCI